MPRRLHPTLADYVIVAINPALIMVLIGSLVYFLLEIFYQGQYPARLHYCLTWFIFGAVLVSRISMEEGWDHAAPFGGALAVVIVLALHRFVSYDGTNLAQIGWLINYGLIALIWWCAHRLTWDCTLIDESQDTSGEGLLQTVGLDSHDGKSEAAATAGKSGVESSHRAVLGSLLHSPNAADDDLPAITVANDAPSAASRAARTTGKKSWWQQFVERRRRPHAPGVWIVYFSLAALPLFGLGQVFIPAANTGSRRYAFLLLCIYVACGLGLLLTTSFLGLRRYLRRRKLEMPTAMAGTWLATGAVLIVGLLLLSALLPRPNAEYAISQLPGATSVQRESSRMAVGKEGTKDDGANSAPGKRSRPDDDAERDPNAKSNGTEPDPSGTSKNGAGESDVAKEGASQSSSDDRSESKPSQDGKSESGESGESSSNKPSDSASDSDSAKNSDADSKQDPNSENAQQREEGQSGSRDGSQSDSAAKPNESPESTPTMQPPDITFLGSEIIAIVKWVFYGALILAAAWWSWRHRSELLAWLLGLLSAWRDFWQNLFGRRSELPEAIQIAPIHRSFSEYTDPFAAGVAGRYPPEELVRYSFEAFEAWARDQGWPRETDQTAYEFARAIATHAPNIAAPARTLAELYSRAAYAPGTLPASIVEHLRSLWQSMKAPQLVA